MNIFNTYLKKIILIIKNLEKKEKIALPDDLNGINVDIPPANFKSDISTNVAMILSKINKKPPKDIAEILIVEIKKNDQNIQKAEFASPGFINIKLGTKRSMLLSISIAFIGSIGYALAEFFTNIT